MGIWLIFYLLVMSGGDGIPVELFQILKDDAVTQVHSPVWGPFR